MDVKRDAIEMMDTAGRASGLPRATADEIAAPYMGDVVRPKLSLSLKFEEVVLAIGMAGIALITAANVVTRYLTNISLAFTEELSMALMVIVALVGTSYAAACGNHIRIGYFIDSLSPRGRRRAELLSLSAVALCFLILAVYGAQMAWDDYSFEAISPGLGYPQWMFSMWLPILSVLILGRVAERAWRIGKGRHS
jgi:TRAP-type C4-dicarboxylate transport system permease small subunit